MVDRLTKVTKFIPMTSAYSASDVVQLFIRNVVRPHGVLKKIMWDKDAKFTSKFWKEFLTRLGTKLTFSTTYHAQRDGQTVRINMMLEDMLRMYVMHQKQKWEGYLLLVVFAYNNGYQKSLRMSLFDTLYGCSCNTPLVGLIQLTRCLLDRTCWHKWNSKCR